jgi:hypothetical protein
MVRDDAGLLRDRLQEIADEDGRVISVIWQPARHIVIGNREINPQSGYIIVSEYCESAVPS